MGSLLFVKSASAVSADGADRPALAGWINEIVLPKYYFVVKFFCKFFGYKWS